MPSGPPELRLHKERAMRERTPKSDLPDDRAGRRAARWQSEDGSLVFVYEVSIGATRVKQGTLTVRLDVDGEMFVAIHGK